MSWAPGLLCGGALVLLVACGPGNKTRPLPVIQELREPALAAVERLRTANATGCEAVQLGSATRFRIEQWNEVCEQIRQEWGEWNAFQPTHWYRPTRHTIAVEVTADFAGEDAVSRPYGISDPQNQNC